MTVLKGTSSVPGNYSKSGSTRYFKKQQSTQFVRWCNGVQPMQSPMRDVTKSSNMISKSNGMQPHR